MPIVNEQDARSSNSEETVKHTEDGSHGGKSELAEAIQADPSMGTATSARAENDMPEEQKNDIEASREESNDAKETALGHKTSLQDQTNLLPRRQLIIVFLGLSVAISLSLLDQTVVATALPTISAAFNRATDSSWVATSYLLTSTAFQPIFGRMSDIFGRKRTILFAMVVFFIGSLACAVAHTMTQLIIFRAIQGMGGGAIISLVMIIVGDVVSLEERGKYQGIIAANVAVSNGIGPLLGGAICDNTTWRWVFWFQLPLSGVAIAVVAFLLPLKHVKGSTISKLKKVDYAGSFLTLSSSILLLVGLNFGGVKYAWSDTPVVVPLVLGFVLAVVFIIWEWKIASLPLMPMRLFRSISLNILFFITFTNGYIYYIQLFYLPQFFQVVRGYTALRSGILLLPLLVIQVLVSLSAGLLTSKTGHYKPQIVSGWCIWTISLGLISTIGLETSLARIIGFLILTGVGAGNTFQTTLVAIQAACDRKEMAAATAVRNFIRMLGGTLSLAVAATIVSNTIRSRDSSLSTELIDRILNDPTAINAATSPFPQATIELVRDAYLDGFRTLWYMTIGVSGFSAVASFLIKHHSLARADDAAQREKSKAWLAERTARHAHHGKGDKAEEKSTA